MTAHFFDAHCDTVYELYTGDKSLLKNDLHLDLSRMEEYDEYIQVFAAYVDQKEITSSPLNHCVSLLERLHREIEKSGGRVRLIRTAEELETVRKTGKIGAVASLEGGEALEGNPAAIWMYYQLGVRLITLTWNYANALADGITEPRGGGLTAFGRKAVAMMEDMGIMVDVSHLSERGFWDVAEAARYPFIASHSCVKALCGHPRNLDDRQLRFLVERGCGVGICLYPPFLTESPVCTALDVVRHMRYVLEMGGGNALGIGTDFDGVDSLPDGIRGVEDMAALRDVMIRQGITPTQTEKICFENFYRIFRDTLARGK